MTLRQVEADTGIHNAHLSQIEGGAIERPDPHILWKLADKYRMDFQRLLRLAGHTNKAKAGEAPLLGAAFRALDELTPREQREVLNYMESLRKSREDKKKR